MGSAHYCGRAGISTIDSDRGPLPESIVDILRLVGVLSIQELKECMTTSARAAQCMVRGRGIGKVMW